MESFFVEWLKAHGEKNIVTDAQGVGLEGNATRLRAAPYSVNKTPTAASVETEFRVALPGGGEIVEYAAGVGNDEGKARADSMVNFVLTTFHVVYKSFLNSKDPHQEIQTVSINGKDREMACGDLYVRGLGNLGAEEMKGIRDGVREIVSRQHLDGRPHWFKFVYGQQNGKPSVVESTRDNLVDDALTASTKALPWPARDAFYMAKVFVVVK